MIRILISGICGQMGHAVYHAIQDSSEFTVAAGVDRVIGAAFDCPVYQSFSEVQEAFDAIIDFSVPAALPDELRFAQRRNAPLVIGEAYPDLPVAQHVAWREPADVSRAPDRIRARRRFRC